MISQKIEIINKTGLHARPASEFTKIASAQKCQVYLEKDGRRINAKSIIGVLTLAIAQGDVVDIITDGENEEECLKILVDFVNQLKE